MRAPSKTNPHSQTNLTTNPFFFILSLAITFRLAVMRGESFGLVKRTLNLSTLSSPSILKLLSGSVPVTGLVLYPRKDPSLLRTNQRGRQFLMYSPGGVGQLILKESCSSVARYSPRFCSHPSFTTVLALPPATPTAAMFQHSALRYQQEESYRTAPRSG